MAQRTQIDRLLKSARNESAVVDECRYWNNIKWVKWLKGANINADVANISVNGADIEANGAKMWS